jgi:hypothetical protein
VRSFLETRQKAGPSRQEQAVYDVLTEDTGTPEVKAQKRAVPGSQKITYEDVAALAHYFRVSYQAASYRLKSVDLINKQELEELLRKEGIGRSYLELLKMIDDLEGRDKRPDRKLDAQIVSLAVEAFRRESISKGKLREIAKLLELQAKELVTLAEAAQE